MARCAQSFEPNLKSIPHVSQQCTHLPGDMKSTALLFEESQLEYDEPGGLQNKKTRCVEQVF